MRHAIFFLLLAILSCNRKPQDPTPGTGSTGYASIRQIFVRQVDSPLGQVFSDPDLKKDALIFGSKNNDGFLKTIRFVMLTDPQTKEWVLYQFNENYLPVWVRLSQGYTLSFTNYDIAGQTVTITGYTTSTQARLGSVDKVKLDKNVFDWANAIKSVLTQDLRGARASQQSCDKGKYNAAAAGYFAVNAAGCALGITEFGTGAGIPVAILSIYNTYQNCKSALGVLGNVASGKPPLDCPSVNDFGNSGLACAEGELNAFSGQPYNFVQSCASGLLANAAAAANCNCDQPDDPFPPARSTGDPHIRTLDQLYYDFQAYGEFTALRTAQGDLEIQVRQQDMNNTGTVTVNTGVAVRTGTDVVNVLVNPSRLYVNKVLQPSTITTLTLPSGATLTQAGNDLTLTNSQTDKITIRWLNDTYLLDYLVTLGAARAGKVSGLLGNFDGDPGNDLAGANGQAVSTATANWASLFADSWRITQAQSLFVYEPGKTTESYTDRQFPRSKPSLSADRLQWAESVCRNAGISNPDNLQDCIYDVAITGDEAITASSAWAQRIDGIAPAVPLPSTSDIRQFIGVRLEIGTSASDVDQLNLLDLDGGTVYKFRDGAANASRVDLVGTTYCGNSLFTPATINYCGISCGTSPYDNYIAAQKWPTFTKGDIRYLSPTSIMVPVGQWNAIQSLSGLQARVKVNLDPATPYASVTIDDSGSGSHICKPTLLQNLYLYAFVTETGKWGVFRITGNGTTPEGRKWYALDIKVQK